MDVDGSGRLTFSEFDAAFQRLDIIVAPELLMEIFQACDADKNGTVDYREFVQEFVTRHEQNAAAVAARQQARQQPLAAPLSTATVTTTSSTSTVEAAVMEPPPAEKHLRDALARVGFGAPSERASERATTLRYRSWPSILAVGSTTLTACIYSRPIPATTTSLPYYYCC